MNGTYLCPPDYSRCAGKVNTCEYSVTPANGHRSTEAGQRQTRPTVAMAVISGDEYRIAAWSFVLDIRTG